MAAAPRHDFGEVLAGDLLRHTFSLRNVGAEPLVIDDVRTSCTCAVGELRVADGAGGWRPYELGQAVPAGSELELAATFEPKNLDQLTRTKLTVVQRDGVFTELELSARAQSYFAVDPPLVDFGTMTTLEKRTRQVVVGRRDAGGGPFALRAEESSPVAGLTVRLDPRAPQGDGRAPVWSVHLTLGPDARVGQQVFPLFFASDVPVASAPQGEPRTYLARVLVQADVRTPVSALPAFVRFGQVVPGTDVVRRVEVRNHDPEFELAEPRVRLVGPAGPDEPFPLADQVATSVVAVPEGFDVELRIGAGLAAGQPGTFRGQLWIETGHPVTESLGVPFFGTVAAR